VARSGGLSHIFMGMLLQQIFGQASDVLGSTPESCWFGLSRSAVNPSGDIDEPPLFLYLDADGATTTTPTDDVVDTGYARVEVLLADQASWSESDVCAVVNSGEVRFPEAQADWGTIRFWVMMDAQVDGRVLAYGSLRRSVRIFSGDVALIAPGSINIALDSYEREW